MDKFDKAFGHGISGGFALGVKGREETAPLVRRLRDVDEGKPERQRLFSRISSLDDRLPADQAEKLAVLAEIRGLIDRQLRHPDALDDADREALARARPPDGLRVLGDADVPEELAWPYIERDGTRGRIILANNGLGIDSWNTHDLRKFASAVEGLGLGPDVLVGGLAFVFTDMLNAMERDGPRATLVAALGAIVVVVLLLGPGGAAAATLFCGALGMLALLALASILGLKVNFLDFIALPITIGIGIDYSVNIISRARVEPNTPQGRAETSRTASAVALCSYTTIVGYGSLWLSNNKGVRSFGLAAMLGELTCLSAALLVAPVLGAKVRRRFARPTRCRRRSSARGSPRRATALRPGPAQTGRQRGGRETEQQAGRDVRHPVMAKVDRREPERNDERQADPEVEPWPAGEERVAEAPGIEQGQERDRAVERRERRPDAQRVREVEGALLQLVEPRVGVEDRGLETAVQQRQIEPGRPRRKHQEQQEPDPHLQNHRRRHLVQVIPSATERQGGRDDHREDEVEAVRQRHPVCEQWVIEAAGPDGWLDAEEPNVHAVEGVVDSHLVDHACVRLHALEGPHDEGKRSPVAGHATGRRGKVAPGTRLAP